MEIDASSMIGQAKSKCCPFTVAEIAFFDRGPIDEKILITGGHWSAYYYNGFIYGTEITRGLDVFKLLPSEYLSSEEISLAAEAYPLFGPQVFNPQQQIPLVWSDRE